MTEAYPLQWPQGRPRTPEYHRRAGQFRKDARNITVREAIVRLQAELDRLDAAHFVLSSNLILNLDGSPRSGQPQPSDPGVALYFQLNGKPHCLPCDTYSRAEQNIAAIAKHLEATRAIERYGVATLTEMFAGFTALPAPKAWWQILGVGPNATPNEIRSAHRAAASKAHPDTGGSHAAMAELNAARDAGLRVNA